MDVWHAFCSSLGLTDSVARVLIVFLASIPCCWMHQFISGSFNRNLYSVLSGFLLSYVAFGIWANLHFLFSAFIGYFAMFFYPKRCGIITFVGCFGFLIACHVAYMSGESWKKGNIDFTAALMIITLKVISCAIDYEDGKKVETELNDFQKQNKITNLPSFLNFFAFLTVSGLHFSGPVFSYSDYINWIEKKREWMPDTKDKKTLSFFLSSFAKSLIALTLYQTLNSYTEIKLFSEPTFLARPVLDCVRIISYHSFTTRWKYYFIWSVSEMCMICSGLGFSGWKSKEVVVNGQICNLVEPDWSRSVNCKIFGVEFAKSSADFPANWNISVGRWLRYYVYERLHLLGIHSKFWKLFVTQIISALWHGLYPGYLCYFVNCALMIAGSRVIHSWQKKISEKKFILKNVFLIMHSLYSSFVNNYAAIGFLVLNFHDTLIAYRSVYFFGTILPIIILIMGNYLNVPAAKRRKMKKME